MAQPRGLLYTVIDRAIGWLWGLPPERCNYTIEPVTIPLKDGGALKADLFQPVGMEPLGTILVQCPYGRGFFLTSSSGHAFTPRGYQVLFVSCRGTFGSSGDFDGGASLLEDGQDVVAWMREQPWYTSSFATIGASYMGRAQWALLCNPPKDMVTAAIAVGPHDFAQSCWPGGTFSLLQRWSWSELIMRQETAGLMERIKMTKNDRLIPYLNAVPLQDQIDAFFSDKAPWLNHSITHPDLDHPSWAPFRHGEALEKSHIPILLVTAWHDVYLGQTMEQYKRLTERKCNVALTICPGGHMDIQKGEPTRDTFAWIERHLAGKQESERQSPVKIFVGGSAQRWMGLPSWPPSTTTSELYLNPDGSLTGSKFSEEAQSCFVFDPEAPTPTLGGPLLRGGGAVDDTALAKRDDTLVFTTEPLQEPLEVLGEPILKLEHSTDKKYADLFVRISEVTAKGNSFNVTETFMRLPESRTSRSVTLTLRPTAHVFAPGTRIQLLIAGGSHPQFARNFGSGEALATGTTLVPVKHTVFYGCETTPSLALPISSKYSDEESSSR